MSMTLISTTTVVGGNPTAITFSGIPQDGTDLLLVFAVRSVLGSVGRDLSLTFNGVTQTNARQLRGNGTTLSSNSSDPLSNAGAGDGGTTANVFTNNSLYITNYASTSLNKPYQVQTTVENNATEAYQRLAAGLYNSTTAVTSLSIGDAGGFMAGSTASLYKITRGSGGATTTP